MIPLVVGALIALALVCVAFVYLSYTQDAFDQAERYRQMKDNVDALASAVDAFREDVDRKFGRTDAGVVKAANRTMDVLNNAIKRESRRVQSSLGRNRHDAVLHRSHQSGIHEEAEGEAA